MSKGARAKAIPHPSSTHSATNPPPAAELARPLTPRPLLLTALSIVFVAWLAFLVSLYFTTVYPRRSASPAQPASPATTVQSIS